MGDALLMDKFPPVFTEAGLELVKAMVEVGPPLLVRELRKGSPEILFVPAGNVLSSTRLLVLVPIVPPPEE